MERLIVKLYGSLNERDRRRFAALEAMRQDRGCTVFASKLLGYDPKTIRRGMAELKPEAPSIQTFCEKPVEAESLRLKRCPIFLRTFAPYCVTTQPEIPCAKM